MSTIKILILSVLSILFLVTMIQNLNAKYLDGVLAMSPTMPSPQEYKKNPWSDFNLKVENGKYISSFQFQDHEGVLWIWRVALDEKETKHSIASFGIPEFITRSHITSANRYRINNGAFIIDDENVLRPDYHEMDRRYGSYGEALIDLADQISAQISDNHLTTKIRTMISFVQDVPYGMPPNIYDKIFINGVFPIPQVFVVGWGDCDTKSLMVVAAAKRMGLDSILVHVPGHMLFGIEGIPGPYARSEVYMGKTYILGEASGPEKVDWGQIYDNYAIHHIYQM